MFLFAIKMKLINLCQISNENTKLEVFINELERNEQEFEFQSSGSTGQPKAYFFTREQLEISAKQTIDFFRLSEEDLLLCPFSMDFVAAKMMLARAYFLNATLVFTGPIGNPFAFKDLPEVSFVALVPKQMQNIFQNEDSLERLNQANNIIIGGAPISAQLENEITRNVTASVFHTYGMTETLTHVAVRNLKEEAALYEGLKGVSFKRDQRGCLQIKSPLSAQWLTTNDLVELTSSGFYWKGRFDLIINSAGYKIQVDSLEFRLSSQVEVNQLFICGINSSEFGEECIVVSNEAKPRDFEKVFESNQFHKYEKPKKWVTLAEFPFGNSGKIQRAKLKELATQAVLNGEYQNLV